MTFLDAVFRFQPKPDEDKSNPEIYLQLAPKLPKLQPNANGNAEPADNVDAEEKAEEAKEDEKQEPEPLTIEKTRTFLRTLAEADENAHPGRERASHLGRIEFEKRIRAANVEAEEGE